MIVYSSGAPSGEVLSGGSVGNGAQVGSAAGTIGVEVGTTVGTGVNVDVGTAVGADVEVVAGTAVGTVVSVAVGAAVAASCGTTGAGVAVAHPDSVFSPMSPSNNQLVHLPGRTYMDDSSCYTRSL
jgi:hypothetical protein